MIADKIQLNGVDYRVRVNWAAYAAFCAHVGINDLSAIEDASKMKPEDLKWFIFFALREGEKAEGRELQLTPDEVESALNIPDVNLFFAIMAKQSGIKTTDIKSGDVIKKKKPSLFRLRR